MPLSVFSVLTFFMGFVVGRYLEQIMSIIGLIRKDIDRMAEGRSKPRKK